MSAQKYGHSFFVPTFFTKRKGKARNNRFNASEILFTYLNEVKEVGFTTFQIQMNLGENPQV